MYNRYIPQPDGTYRRNRMQDVGKPPEKQMPAAPPPQMPPREPETPPCVGCIRNTPPRRPVRHRESRTPEKNSVSSFLKQLLPKEFDMEDLLVILLLLLMSGDCQENQNTALLTLVLYLFL